MGSFFGYCDLKLYKNSTYSLNIFLDSNVYPHKISKLYPYFIAFFISSENNISSQVPIGAIVLLIPLTLTLVCKIGCLMSSGAIISQ